MSLKIQPIAPISHDPLRVVREDDPPAEQPEKKCRIKRNRTRVQAISRAIVKKISNSRRRKYSAPRQRNKSTSLRKQHWSKQ